MELNETTRKRPGHSSSRMTYLSSCLYCVISLSLRTGDKWESRVSRVLFLLLTQSSKESFYDKKQQRTIQTRLMCERDMRTTSVFIVPALMSRMQHHLSFWDETYDSIKYKIYFSKMWYDNLRQICYNLYCYCFLYWYELRSYYGFTIDGLEPPSDYFA